MAALILDDDHVGRVVDDNCVVDVGENHIVGRRHHVARRVTPDRNRDKYRDRQHKLFDDQDRRRQHREIRRSWRQEIDRGRRRWWEIKVRIVKSEYRPIYIDYFLGRRWWHVVIDHGERCRRLQGRG